MSVTTSWLTTLKSLLFFTFFSSILHYADNLLFFSDYPEPAWIHPHMIDLFWVLMTSLAPLGYLSIKKGHLQMGTFLLGIYGLCNMFTLGHYNYAPLNSISSKIHLFIVIEALLGGILLCYVLIPYWRFARRRN